MIAAYRGAFAIYDAEAAGNPAFKKPTTRETQRDQRMAQDGRGGDDHSSATGARDQRSSGRSTAADAAFWPIARWHCKAGKTVHAGADFRFRRPKPDRLHATDKLALIRRSARLPARATAGVIPGRSLRYRIDSRRRFAGIAAHI